MAVKNLSVFFPAFNEALNIPTTVEKAVGVLKGLNLDNWEVLIINDGSTDNEKEVGEELEKKFPNVRLINQTNGGYGKALRAGFKNSKYDWIVYTDADGQFDFSEINKFLEKSEDADFMIGYRMKRRDPFFRLLFAKGWALSLFIFFGLHLRDVDCGFKMIRREVLEAIPPLESTRGGMINAELAIKAKKMGFRVIEIGVHHYPRLAGKPTGANIKVVIISYLNLLKLWWKLS